MRKGIVSSYPSGVPVHPCDPSCVVIILGVAYVWAMRAAYSLIAAKCVWFAGTNAAKRTAVMFVC